MLNGLDLKDYLNPVFIETGFASGDDVQAALTAGFETIISIEMHKWRINKGRQRFRQEIEDGRVFIVEGNSSVKLAEVLQLITEPCTFWLHANFMRSRRTPLLKELAAIAAHPINTHTIIIDDATRFLRRGIDIQRDIETVFLQRNPRYGLYQPSPDMLIVKVPRAEYMPVCIDGPPLMSSH